MDFVIQIENGQPINHPIAIDNFLSAFPGVDINNLPPGFVEFKRTNRPVLAPYGIMDSLEYTYGFIDGVWTNVWPIREMTAEEKASKIEAEHFKFFEMNRVSNNNFSAWNFNEELCKYRPPFPSPSDGKAYFWQGTTSSWVVLTEYPNDGKSYRLDYASATWVENLPIENPPTEGTS